MFKPNIERVPFGEPREGAVEQASEQTEQLAEDFVRRREEILKDLFPSQKNWEGRTTYYQGEEMTIKEVLEKNPGVFALQKWENGDVVWEERAKAEGLETKFCGSETLNGLETQRLEEKIKGTLTPEALAVLESLEFIDKRAVKGRWIRGENAMGVLSGKAKIRLYKHNLSAYDEGDVEGRMYELQVSAFHEIGHALWRSFMLPSRLGPQETPRGIEAQIIGSEDREEWFKIFVTESGNKLLEWVDETLFKDKISYEYSDKLEEGWCHVFAQVGVNPGLLDKDPRLKHLMGKYIK